MEKLSRLERMKKNISLKLKYPCGCSKNGDFVCQLSEKIWNKANSIYYAFGYEAWQKELDKYHSHYNSQEAKKCQTSY